MTMIKETIDDLKSSIKKAEESLRRELAKVRTGRANPDVLDGVRVEYYGTPTPLKQMASISVPEPRMILLKPFDRSTISTIERAIGAADLGLNPSNDGEIIRIPMPPLTEERRRDLTKVVKHEAENARVAIRNVRRDVLQDLKEMLKEKMISEDVERKAHEEVQKLTDRHVADVDAAMHEKEKELMQV